MLLDQSFLPLYEIGQIMAMPDLSVLNYRSLHSISRLNAN